MRWACEINSEARSVLAARFPGVRLYDDVKELTFAAEEGSTPSGGNWRLSEAQKIEATRLYDIGLSCGVIAEYFGVSRQSMWDVLRRRTAMRPKERSGSDNHFYRGGSTADDHAQNLLEYALKTGAVRRHKRCEKCGASGVMADGRRLVQAHHPDYNRPLDVMWLCQPCHHAWHKQNRAIPVEGGDANESLETSGAKHLVPRVDVLCGGFP